MQTTGKKVITRVLGLTYAPCMDTYTNMSGITNKSLPQDLSVLNSKVSSLTRTGIATCDCIPDKSHAHSPDRALISRLALNGLVNTNSDTVIAEGKQDSAIPYVTARAPSQR